MYNNGSFSSKIEQNYWVFMPGLLTWLDRKWRKPTPPPVFSLWNSEIVGEKWGAAFYAMYQRSGADVKETTAGMDFYGHAHFTGFALGSMIALAIPFIYYGVTELYRSYRYRQFKAKTKTQLSYLLEIDNTETLRYWLRGDARIFDDLLAYDEQQENQLFRDRIWTLLTENPKMGRSVAERILTLSNANRLLLEKVLTTYKDELEVLFKTNPKESWILLEMVQGDLFLREAIANFYQSCYPPKETAKGYYYELNYVRRPWWWPASFYISWDARIILGPGGGALLGATIGTFILPGLGSAIGYVIGGLFGFLVAFGRDEFFPRWRAKLIHDYYKTHDRPPAFMQRRKWYREANVDLPLYAHIFPAAMAGMGIGVAYGAFGALIAVSICVTTFVVLPYVWRFIRSAFDLDNKVYENPTLIRKAVKMAWWRRSYWDMPSSYRFAFGVMLGTVLGGIFPSLMVNTLWSQVLGITVGHVMAGGLTCGILALFSPMIIDVILKPIMKTLHPPISKMIHRWQVWLGQKLGVLKENQKELDRDPLWVESDAPWYIVAAPAAVAMIAVCTVFSLPLTWGVGGIVSFSLLYAGLYKFFEPVSVWIRKKLDIQFSDAVIWSLRMMGFQSIFAMTCAVIGANISIGAMIGAGFGIAYPYLAGLVRAVVKILSSEQSVATACRNPILGHPLEAAGNHNKINNCNGSNTYLAFFYKRALTQLKDLPSYCKGCVAHHARSANDSDTGSRLILK